MTQAATPALRDSTPMPPRRQRGLATASATTAGASMAAVLTGLLLDVTIAFQFGAGEETDAFFVAARLPVGVAMVLLSGANLALVPVLTNMLVRRSAGEARASTTSLLVLVGLGSCVIAALVAVAAPVLVVAMAPGLDAGSSDTAAALLRLLAAVVPLTAVAEVLRAMANARDSFVLPAATNVVLNGTAAAVILLMGDRGIQIAAWAYLAGGAARVTVLAVSCWRLGWRPRWRCGDAGGWRDRQALDAVRLSSAPALGAGLAPAVRIVEQIFASFLPAGAISILNYGYRLIFAIGGTVVFRSVLGVLAPKLARAHEAGDRPAGLRLTRDGVRMVLVLAVVLVVLITTLGTPAALAVFHRGSFDRTDAVLLGAVLGVLSLCLVAEGVQRALMAPFYAGLDTRAPLRNSMLTAAVNVALIPALMLPFAGSGAAVIGIAAAFVIADHVGAWDAWRRWRAHPTAGSLGAGRLGLGLAVGALFAVPLALWLRDLLELDSRSNPVVALALVALVSTLTLVVLLAGPVLADRRGTLAATGLLRKRNA